MMITLAQQPFAKQLIAALAAGEPVAFEGAETVYLIQTIDMLPELFSGAETCWDCKARPASNALTVVIDGRVSYHSPLCWPCAAKAQNGGVAPEPPPAIIYPEPVEVITTTAPVYNPEIRNPRRGLYNVQSETRPEVFYNVFMSGSIAACSCPGRFHKMCKHRRVVAPLWAATLQAEEAQRQAAAREVVAVPFDDGWEPAIIAAMGSRALSGVAA